MVVHREPEQDHEQEDREERRDAAGRVEPEELLPPAVLEDEHEDPVGGRDGEEVEDDRLRRDHERAEGEQEEQEREARARTRTRRGDGLHLVVEVLRLGGEAADGDLGVRDRADGRRDDVVPQRREGGVRGPSLPLPSIGIATFATVPSSSDVDEDRLVHQPAGERALLERGDRRAGLAGGDVVGPDDDVRRDLGAGERRLEPVVVFSTSSDCGYVSIPGSAVCSLSAGAAIARGAHRRARPRAPAGAGRGR